MGFKNFQLQTPQGKTVRYTLAQLRAPQGCPVLVVEHLGETNSGYWLDALSRAKAESATALATAGIKKEISATEMDRRIKEARAAKRETVALHAIRDVENLFHDDGSAATKADIFDLVMALPDDVFDDVWRFAENANNFRESAIVGNVAAIAGK